jgi:cytochrome c-type biogenesis protein CcsB
MRGFMLQDQTILSMATLLYIFGAGLYFSNPFLKIPRIGKLATLVTGIAFLAHTLSFIVRWTTTYRMGLGHLHIVTLYESLAFIVWAIVLAYLLLEIKFKNKLVGSFVIPLAAVVLIYTTMVLPSTQSTIAPVPEVLHGNFYNYHVIPCFFGYGAFTISFGASILYFIKKRKKAAGSTAAELVQLSASMQQLNEIIYKAIAIGFIFFTIQLIAGMFRTKIIWGSYWQWDPTQVLGLTTWLIYSVILHGRFTRWWKEDMTAMVSIIGYISAILGFLAATGRMVATGHYPIL